MEARELQRGTPLFDMAFKAAYKQQTMREHKIEEDCHLRCHECNVERSPVDTSLRCKGPYPELKNKEAGCRCQYTVECCRDHAELHLLSHLPYELDAKWLLGILTEEERLAWLRLHREDTDLPEWHGRLLGEDSLDLANVLLTAMDEIEDNEQP